MAVDWLRIMALGIELDVLNNHGELTVARLREILHEANAAAGDNEKLLAFVHNCARALDSTVPPSR